LDNGIFWWDGEGEDEGREIREKMYGKVCLVQYGIVP